MLSLSDAGSNLASCSPALNITTLLVPSAQGALASSAAELPEAALRAEGAGTAAGARAVLLTASGADAPAGEGEGEGEGGGGVYPGGFSSLAEGVECTLAAPPLAQAGRRVAWDTRGMARQVGIPATSNLTVSGVILYNLAPTGSRYPGQATAFLPEEGDKVGGDTGAASPPPLAAQSPTAKAFANHSLSLWLFDFDRDLSASPLSPGPFPLRLRNVTLVVPQAELDLLRHMLKQASRLPPDASAPAPGGPGRRTLLGGALEGPPPRGRRVVLSGLDDTPAAAQAAAAARLLAAAESSEDAASRVDRWRGCVYTHLVWFAAESRVTSASSDTLVFSSLRHYGWRGSDVTVTSALPPDTPTLLLQAPGQGGDGEVIVIDVMAGCPVVTDPVVPSPPLPTGDSPANGSIGATGPALEPIPDRTPNNEGDDGSSAPSPGLVAGAVVGSVAAAVAAAAVAVRVAKRRRRSRSGSQVLHDGSYAALDSAGNSNDSSRGGRGGADGSASDLWAAVGLPRRAPAPGAEPQDPAPTVAILLEADAAEGGAPERAVERARRPGGGRFSARALSRLCAASGAPSHPAPTAAPRTVAPSGPIPATQTTASPAEPGPAATAAVAAAGPVRSPAGAGQDPALDDSSDGGGGSLCFAGRSRRRLTIRNDTGGSRFSTPTGAGVLPLPPPLFAAEEAAGRTGPLAQAQVSIHLADEPPAAAAGAGGGGDGGGTTGSKRRRWGRVISGSQLEAAAATAAAGAAGSLLAGAGAAGGIAAAAASWGGPREGPMAEAEIRIQLADEAAAAGAGSSRSRRRWGVRISSAGA
ncbi:hypothetical protein HYH03_017596 [Edaphochlamys debaryana]|uniref:Uncharacterized protein n=1 Tax=Edaphochlamys debaryana TaxID=47281 RepID=A0A835XFD6_9CHLO|nr:hypothetical protein HYH03_017596 [Edaphochlamys debaryana]|eukprot:KAG2483542.1 hypothetical protein HYH03_017596 [Edaphochlamys debaryana]